MRRFTLAPKFILFFSVLLTAVVIMAVIGFQGMINIRAGGEEIYRNYLTSIVNLRNAEQQLADIALLQKAHIIAPNETVMKDIEAEMAQARDGFRQSMRAFAVTLDAGEESELYYQYLAGVENLFELNEKIIELSIVNNDIEADAISEGSFARVYRRVFDLGKQMLETNIEGGEALSQRNNADFEKVKLSELIIFTIVMGLFFALGVLVRRHLIDALKELTDTMKALAAGDLNRHVPLMGRTDEIGDMARATRQFKEMALQLEESEELAKASASAKSDFLASMSHEIRTPLNGVLGIVELLQDTELSEQQKQYLKTVERSGRVLNHVINDILDYSKIEAGAMELNPQPFDFHSFLEQLESTFQIKKRSDISFNLISEGSIPKYLVGDEPRLHQIIGNLLSNAFKFTEKGSVTLTVLVSEQSDKEAVILFKVSDTGIGISPGNQVHIFEPFRQADQSTHRRFGGTGLGLVICRQLVERMGGQVDLKSQEGQGSTFYVSLPMAIASEEAITAISHSDIQPTLAADHSRIQVLLVEDNATNQIVACGLLKKLGVQVRVAENGIEAVDLVCNSGQNYDLILMDCEMPLMDGYEVTRRIRQWEKTKQKDSVKICALTAHAVQEYLDRCYEAGMNEHIIKPYKMQELQLLVEGVSAQSMPLQ
ncbi:MAG: hypothetical protein AseanaTS_15720 [Candidatus Pelagadaptatus aseana]|uniref:ATP-binding protein n=1 Tax=Candidatus Pelagadaptatus aseana TaxID=3120508 RepID=UPI0039B34893